MSILNEAQQQAIVNAIKAAENKTSGEIKVHIEAHVNNENVLSRASEVFAMLNMHHTDQRNGVLIYVASLDRKFAIIGDEAINTLVADDFWNETKNTMKQCFLENNFAEGICAGVLSAGNQLQFFFPRLANDINELSDDISFG